MNKLFVSLKKYNFWSDAKIDVGFERKLYLERIQNYFGNNLVKVLIGQRRTGKSYLIRQIINGLIHSKNINPMNIFYLNKELIDFDLVKDYHDLSKLFDYYRKKLKVSGKIYIFLDEVQEISGWEKIVNSWSQDYKNKYEVILTGSNSKLLSSELATYLSGRFVNFLIFPFNFSEYCGYLKIEKNKTNFLLFLKDGGLPELFKLSDSETKRHYISSLKDTILLNDIVKKFGVKDSVLLDRLFRYILDNLGGLFSLKNILFYLEGNKVKSNYETISNYISYLTQAMLVHEAFRYNIKGKEVLLGERKYYINDLSFRNYLSSGFDEGLSGHLENYVYTYLKSQGFEVYVGNLRNLEIDFVAEKKGVKKYFQVTYSLSDPKNAEREFAPLKKIEDNFEKAIISLDDVSFGNKDGIAHLLAWELE